MQDSEEFKKQVTTNLRACLISSQGGIPANSLNNDYKQLLGEPIPFRKLGFTNLESFLKSIPEINLRNVNGTILVEAKKTACSTHITKLVEKQRKGGKRRSRKSNKLKCPPRPKEGPFRAPRFEKSGLRSNRGKPPPPTMDNQENQTRAYKSPPPVFHAPKTPPIKQPDLPNFTPMPVQFTNPNIASPSPQYSFMVPPTPMQFHLCPQPHVTSVPSTSMSSMMPPIVPNINPTLMLKQQTFELRQQFQQFPPQQNIPPLMSAQQLSFSKKKSKISAQKRLEALKKIKLDVKNSNNLAHFRTAVPIPTDLSEDSYYYKLLDFVYDRGWPEPEVSLSQQKGGNIICTVSIKCSKPGEQSYMSIGEQQFTTYPDEIRDPYIALEEGSKKAVNAITSKSSENYVVTNDSNLILARIAEMVQDKNNGVWAFQIEKDYNEKFHECLPPKWIDIVMNSNILTANDLGQSYVVKPLNHQNSFSSHGETSSEAEFLEYYNEDTSNRNLPEGSNTKNCLKDEAKISTINQIVIPKLKPPTAEHWDVFISRAQSYSEIWIRLVGEEYSQKLEDLTTDLELHYHNDNSRVLPQIDNYYAAVCDESVYRIIVKEIYTNEALVHFVDYGDDEIVLLSAIKELLPKFCSLPSQALLVSLSGLECTSKLDYREDIMDKIIGKSYVGFVEEREPYYLVLFDTSTSVDVDLNELLIDEILTETLYEPMVLKIGAVTEVRVTHVDSSGQVFIQLTNSPALDFLQEKLEDIYKEEYQNDKMIKLNFNKIYLIKQEGKLQRVTVLPTTNFLKEKIEVFFVDEGKTESICITELFEVADTYDVLRKIPHQAKRIYLKDIPPGKLTKNKINKLREIAPPNRPVISKVVEIISSPETDIPVLELFIRNQTDRLLSSVNHSIELEDLLESNGEPVEIRQFENLRITDSWTKKVDNFLTRTLMPTHIEDRDIFVWNGKGDLLTTHRAEIPVVDEKYFEIYVDDVANPTNFTVQPLKYLFQLNNLTKEMKQFYDKTKPVLNNPYQFEVYAVKASDGYWYRASVHRILNDDITVRLCDFGHLDVVSLGSMRPLHKNFMILPFLGFKATLAGIAAKYKDWNASDCIRIKELIKGKKFNSIIKEVAHLKDEIILSLEITDTSSSVDINIAHQLVIEGIAVYT